MVGGHDEDAAGQKANGTASQQTILNGISNGHLENGVGNTEKKPGSLRVVVVGAGIGGLTAAIALRRQGHEVVVRFEWNISSTLKLC